MTDSFAQFSPKDSIRVIRDSLSDEQKTILNLIWAHTARSDNQYPARSLQRSLGQTPISNALTGLSGDLLFETYDNGERGFKITLLGSLVVPDGEEHFQLLVQLLTFVKQEFHSNSELRQITSSVIEERLGRSGIELLFRMLRLGIPMQFPIFLVGGNKGEWLLSLKDEVIDLYTANDVSIYALRLIVEGYDPKKPYSHSGRILTLLPNDDGILGSILSRTNTPQSTNTHHYIDAKRLDEIRKIGSKNYDCRRLLMMCTELNECAAKQLPHAVIVILRAILDHVPPIFGCRSFQEVANSYGSSKSFKEAMQNLEGFSRKTADMYLHSQISAHVQVPTMQQVNYSPPLDMLLAEVVINLSKNDH